MITFIALMSSSALAQDFDAGKFEYQSSCETCHGADGKGKGPLSAQLKVPPADLTVLAKKNNGVFPVMHVYEVIDEHREPTSVFILGYLLGWLRPSAIEVATLVAPATW
jgi:hypothetical protein